MRNRWALLTILVLAAGWPAGCRKGYVPASGPAPPGIDSDSPEVGELGRIAYGRTDKGPGGHNFTEVYERFFAPLKNRPIRLFEIGIASGGSLLNWRDYFPLAQIYGIDIEGKSELDSDRIHTLVADQSSREQLGAFLGKFGDPFDIIIDDGGHSMEMQQVSLGYLFRHVRPGGYYVVEDVHTSLRKYHGGYGERQSLKPLRAYGCGAGRRRRLAERARRRSALHRPPRTSLYWAVAGPVGSVSAIEG